MSFTKDELRTLHDHGIAIFRGKLILNAQPPINEDQIVKVEEKIDGKIPTDLLALWRTSFGGELDYDYEVMFGEHLYTASFRELFYPESKGYYDLFGWIESELESTQEAAQEREAPIPERIQYLPFGGFDYLERFYASLRPDEYGQVLIYARGIPWKGRLNEDSIGVVARSVSDLFDQLELNEDPFSETVDEDASGKQMVEGIRELQSQHPTLAEKLEQTLRRSIVVPWREVVEKCDFSRPLSAGQAKALRLALEHAATRGDIDLVNQLHQSKAPFNTTLRGTAAVLQYALARKSFALVERLVGLGVDLGKAPILSASECPDALLLKLIDRRVFFDEEAVYSAAETGAIEGAMAVSTSSQVLHCLPGEIVQGARERARRHEEDAGRVERRELGSYLTPAQYRERAETLRKFADRLAGSA